MLQGIVAAIRENNPGRPIPATSVKGFPTIADVNAWMLENPEGTLGALHFLEVDGRFDYIVQVNQTVRQGPQG